MGDLSNGVWIEFPYTPSCDHPKPFQYVPKNDKVAIASAERNRKEAKVRYDKALLNGLKQSLSAVWDMEMKKETT